MKPSFLKFDDVDSRREIIRCLEILTPLERIAFLRWAAKNTPNRYKLNVAAKTTGDLMESWIDLSFLFVSEGLDAKLATDKLVAMVRRK